MKVDESNFDLLKKASDITYTDYEIKWFNAEHIKGYIEEDVLLSMIEDLICEVDHQKELYEDLKKDIEDNYKYVGNDEPDWHDIQDHKPSWWFE